MSTHNVCFYVKAILMSTSTCFYGERHDDSNEYLQHMFLWRTDENYLLIIIKYPHLFF